MIEIKDVGIIISSSHFQEKFLIVRCFSENHGIIAGLVRVGRKKNDVIPGNIVVLHWKARINEQLGYLSVEVLHSTLAQIMFSSSKISILNSTISMLKSALKEREVNKAIFEEAQDLLYSVCGNTDANVNYKSYVNFEAKLLNSCGYGLDWSKCAVTNSQKNIKYISPKTGNAVTQVVGEKYKNQLFELPMFLIDGSIDACAKDILSALNILGYFIEKYIFAQHHIKIPKMRSILVMDIERNLEQ
ncbi:DNA repair protein RecO [Candidatus Bandiella euplotis]|uniref:DNA repair protein RecO n=1 Tax=Candidatus Bandiella euplotis TaxID=1664265 RepID=A0ABZ0US39_9RICK|nr:DNA repair protein RecO [Candidatus Bandiella woodruffii]WPX96875.1 DNA repair protein RecO [Candidatus Bandiella woodruffii]